MSNIIQLNEEEAIKNQLSDLVRNTIHDRGMTFDSKQVVIMFSISELSLASLIVTALMRIFLFGIVSAKPFNSANALCERTNVTPASTP